MTAKPIEVVETKTGRYKTGAALQEAIHAAIGPALKRAAEHVVSVEQAGTPVVSGYLRAHWTAGTPEWEGDTLLIKVTNPTPYGPRVNLMSIRSRGFVHRGFLGAKAEATDLIKEGAHELAGALWEKE